MSLFYVFFQAEDGIRDLTVTGVQTCALPICAGVPVRRAHRPVAPRGSGGGLRGCGGNPPPHERRWHRSLRAAADPCHLGDLPGAVRLGPVPATLALWNVRGRGNRT